MDIFFSLLGTFILLFVFFDMLWTTMGEGGGPLATRLLNTTWKGFLRVHKRYERAHLFSFAGIVLIITVLLLWIFLLWLGWTLIFLRPEGAVIDLQTGGPADFWDRVYFMGFSIFTLGIGDFRPQTSLYQVLTNVASLSGLFLITLSITYVLSVVQAATQKRKLAVYIASIGRSAEEILLTTWDSRRFNTLEEHLSILIPQIAELKQRHLTYPALHYFHGIDPSEAAALSVATLDDALNIIEHGMESSGYVDQGLLRPARNVLGEFLNTLNATFIDPAEEAPPLPNLEALRRQGLPLVDDATFQSRMESQRERRKLLKALVKNDGWEWEYVLPEREEERTLKPDEA